MPTFGFRVVRGPDWKWEDQDGGEGALGVAVLGNREDGKVDIVWDRGAKANYRAGFDQKHDLRIFDAAIADILHREECNCCNSRDRAIKGFRWQCVTCRNFNLCSKCYMSGKHDLTHSFQRIADQEGQSQAVQIPPRRNSRVVVAFGIAEGATVVRGRDWQWQDQDGGPKSPGKVLSISNWKDDSGFNAAANVVWANTKRVANYRLGYGGMMDLACVQSAKYSNYYPDHLPVLSTQLNSPTQSASAGNQDNTLSLMFMQMLLGSWNSSGREAALKTSIATQGFRTPGLQRQLSEASRNQCPQLRLCKQFIQQLVDSEYLDDNKMICYCKSCCVENKIPAIEQAGVPKKDYGVPMDWCLFGLVLPPRAKTLHVAEKWHIAFHGTVMENVKSILEHDTLLKPGEAGMNNLRVKEGPGHYNDNWKPEGFNTKQVFFSPTIRYAGHPCYAKPFKWVGSGDQTYDGQVAFQVRIEPDSYNVGPETVLDCKNKHIRIDQVCPNEQLEWMTEKTGVFIFTGLMVHLAKTSK